MVLQEFLVALGFKVDEDQSSRKRKGSWRISAKASLRLPS